MHRRDVRQSGAGGREAASLLAPIRVDGGATVTFTARPDMTIASRVGAHGGFRVFVPKTFATAEAVIVNTGGGMAGGDSAAFEITAEDRAFALATTPSAERVYRSLGPYTRSSVRLTADAGARLLWLPQETILFSGARLARRLEADVAASATLVVCEIVVFGREAMGEMLGSGSFLDQWRIRRDGRLAYAEAIRLDGYIASMLASKAIAGGARVMATLLAVTPDAEDRLPAVRACLNQTHVCGAASSWNKLLAVRMLGQRVDAVRGLVAEIVPVLANAAMPRVWAI